MRGSRDVRDGRTPSRRKLDRASGSAGNHRLFEFAIRIRSVPMSNARHREAMNSTRDRVRIMTEPESRNTAWRVSRARSR